MLAASNICCVTGRVINHIDLRTMNFKISLKTILDSTVMCCSKVWPICQPVCPIGTVTTGFQQCRKTVTKE